MKIKIAMLCFLLAACGQSEGTRCNPLQFSGNGVQGDCDDGYACVYPTAPNCGIAYCCTVDSTGSITDRKPICQPDPALQSACMLDLSQSTTSGATDAGESD